MTKKWIQLLKSPGDYFDSFMDSQPSWLIAYAAFYMASFVKTIGNLVFSEIPPSTGVILGRSFVGALGAGLISMFLMGLLWAWVGSRIVGGKASIAITTKACGYAFLYPSIFGLLTVPLMLWIPGQEMESNWPVVIGILSVQISVGFWSLYLAFLGVKRLNHFNWIKTLIVVIWFPVLLSMVAILGYFSFI